MTSDGRARIGMIGMAVMGRSLALNMNDHGFRVAVFNREPGGTASAVAESRGTLVPTASLSSLIAALDRPRVIMMMIRAGSPVDEVLRDLQPLLDPGDIVIDGGNSWYEDTQRRERSYAAAGLRFFGVGVSGGEEGARHGPSLMPGGDAQAYEHVQPVFEAIAARTDAGPCVTYIGPDGAGHFVKMVHNGIEYADMQLIAEAYDLLRRAGGLSNEALAGVFDEWNRGPLESFLIELTATLLRKRDQATGGALVDAVLDKAGQKGTGQWTARVALELGVSVPSITAALDARVLSSLKTERVAASRVLQGPPVKAVDDVKGFVNEVRDALYASKVVAYAQGLGLIAHASRAFKWNIDLGELARIWKGGCIIRARLLDVIRQAYARDASLPHLLLDADARGAVNVSQPAWRSVTRVAVDRGIPVPGMSNGLAYYDSLRTARLPQNLTQAQRDAFGAHTYQRVDDPDGPFVHSDWLN